jgi:hypothetical protein
MGLDSFIASTRFRALTSTVRESLITMEAEAQRVRQCLLTDAATGRFLREAVTHPDLLKAAAAGADWTCGHCGATNRGDAPRCDNCRAERASGWQTQAALRHHSTLADV